MRLLPFNSTTTFSPDHRGRNDPPESAVSRETSDPESETPPVAGLGYRVGSTSGKSKLTWLSSLFLTLRYNGMIYGVFTP